MATCCLAGQHKVNKPLQRRPSSSFVHSQATSAARLGRTLAGRTTTTGFNLPLGRRAKHKRVKYGRSAGQLRALATTTTTSGTCIAAAPSKRSFFFFSCSDVAVSRALGLLCPQSSSSVPLLRRRPHHRLKHSDRKPLFIPSLKTRRLLGSKRQQSKQQHRRCRPIPSGRAAPDNEHASRTRPTIASKSMQLRRLLSLDGFQRATRAPKPTSMAAISCG